MKEAYVKCTGEGIVVDLAAIKFNIKECLDSNIIIGKESYHATVSLGGLDIDWTIKAWMADETHIIAIIVDKPGINIPESKWITMKDLVSLHNL